MFKEKITMILLSILMFLCVISFGLGSILFLVTCLEKSKLSGIYGIIAVCGMLGMFILTIPYAIIQGY